MTGLRYFAERGKILYLYFRDVLGSVPKFREALIDESNLDIFVVMQTLNRA